MKNFSNSKYKAEYDSKEGLYRIVALRNFEHIKVGDVGGFIEKESNLSEYNNCWVYDSARVSGNAGVYDSARVSGNAGVYDNARVYGSAEVYGSARVYDSARVSGSARVYGSAMVYDSARVEKPSDYIVLKNNLTSGRYYTYTFSNDSWAIGCFYGNTEKLKEHLKENANELQQLEYLMAIEYVQKLSNIKKEHLK